MAQRSSRRLNWARLPLIATVAPVLCRELALRASPGKHDGGAGLGAASDQEIPRHEAGLKYSNGVLSFRFRRVRRLSRCLSSKEHHCEFRATRPPVRSEFKKILTLGRWRK